MQRTNKQPKVLITGVFETMQSVKSCFTGQRGPTSAVDAVFHVVWWRNYATRTTLDRVSHISIS